MTTTLAPPITTVPTPVPEANNYADTIVQTWSWTRGYPPWVAELKLALDDFGRDTLLTDRLGTVVRVGGIFATTLQAPCPCANTPFNQTDWYAIEASFHPKAATVKEKPKVCDPPWDVEDCNQPERDLPPNFLPRPPLKYTYFVHWDAVRGAYVGRSFFQCEQTICTHGESAYFLVSDFSGLEYIGNLVDTPEKFVLTLASEIPGAISPDILKFGSSYVKKVNDARHFL
jgi:hypothetical protein